MAVCLGHKDLDFTFGLKLGRSDDFILGDFCHCHCSYLNNREKKNTVMKSLIDVAYKRNFLKQSNAYHAVSCNGRPINLSSIEQKLTL